MTRRTKPPAWLHLVRCTRGGRAGVASRGVQREAVGHKRKARRLMFHCNFKSSAQVSRFVTRCFDAYIACSRASVDMIVRNFVIFFVPFFFQNFGTSRAVWRV